MSGKADDDEDYFQVVTEQLEEDSFFELDDGTLQLLEQSGHSNTKQGDPSIILALESIMATDPKYAKFFKGAKKLHATTPPEGLPYISAKVINLPKNKSYKVVFNTTENAQATYAAVSAEQIAKSGLAPVKSIMRDHNNEVFKHEFLKADLHFTYRYPILELTFHEGDALFSTTYYSYNPTLTNTQKNSMISDTNQLKMETLTLSHKYSVRKQRYYSKTTRTRSDTTTSGVFLNTTRDDRFGQYRRNETGLSRSSSTSSSVSFIPFGRTKKQ